MSMDTEYIAHQDETKQRIQTVAQHAVQTARLCREFAVPEWKSVLFAIGMYHDVGKYQQAFQRRIRGEKVSVEHAVCGAKAVREQYGENPVTLLMAYCIAGHHTGLPDGGTPADQPDETTLHGRLKRQFENYQAYQQDLECPPLDIRGGLLALIRDCGKDTNRLIDNFAFFTRYAFSCLVDADSVDTASFYDPECQTPLQKQDFSAALRKVNAVLDQFLPVTALQKARQQIQEQVFQRAQESGEIYLLDMPTGSGKTLTSVKIALEKAIRGEKKRIIYVIPYNNIIDQTAELFEHIFGDDLAILRHQSTFSYGDKADETRSDALQNWDAPFIITTSVQFFESVYSNKRRTLRKLHRMADSILIFDEVHLMPWAYLGPCLQAIACITRYLNSEALFLTATMPDFPSLFRTCALPETRLVSLTPDPRLFAPFRKCRYTYLREQSVAEILEKSRSCPSALIIVNTKKAARIFYEAAGTGHVYHLSTYMTARDRKRVLNRIRQDLKELEQDYPDMGQVPPDRRITILSTSLIEAGVDLDVYTVFRERAGLDHILQAGGRCNREGKQPQGLVYVFDLAEDGIYPPKDEEAHLAKGLLETCTDISEKSCIQEYYRQLASLRAPVFEVHSMHRMCSRLDAIPFRTYGEQFRFLNIWTKSLVIPQDEKSRQMIEALRSGRNISLSALQPYTCSITPRELDDLLCQHAAADCGTGIFYLTNEAYYKERIGITLEAPDYFL